MYNQCNFSGQTPAVLAGSPSFWPPFLDDEFWFPSPNATNWINEENIGLNEVIRIRALAWIYVFEIIFALFGSLFSWGYSLCDTGEGPDPFSVRWGYESYTVCHWLWLIDCDRYIQLSIGAGLSSYTICIGGVMGFLAIKFNSIINLEVNVFLSE